MAGLYEIWRDVTVAEGRAWSVRLVRDGDHDDRRGLTRPDPRPDADAGRAPVVRRVARPSVTSLDNIADLLVPAAPGRLTAYPVSRRSTTETTEPNWSSRLPPRRGACGIVRHVTTEVRTIATAQGDARLHASGSRLRAIPPRRSCSDMGPARARIRAISSLWQTPFRASASR